MRLYHGTAAYKEILAAGFDPECVGRNYDEEAGGLQTHAGIYMTSDLKRAASYAARIPEPTPSLVVLEVDEADLIADEDMLSLIARRGIDPKFYQELRGLVMNGSDPSLLDDYESFVATFMQKTGIDQTGQNTALVGSYIALLAEADYDDTCSPDFVRTATTVAKLGRKLVQPDWCAEQGFHYSVRVIDAQPRILGHVTLHLEASGLAIVGSETSGNVTDDETEIFLDHLVTCLADENPDFDATMPSKAIVAAV